METTDFHEIFTRVKKQLAPYGKKMEIRLDTTSSYQLYIIKNVELFGRQFKECYFSGAVVQKTMVSLHFFPIYTHPKECIIPPAIKKNLKGKSCFNFKKLDDEQEKALGLLLKDGFDLYNKKFDL